MNYTMQRKLYEYIWYYIINNNFLVTSYTFKIHINWSTVQYTFYSISMYTFSPLKLHFSYFFLIYAHLYCNCTIPNIYCTYIDQQMDYVFMGKKFKNFNIVLYIYILCTIILYTFTYYLFLFKLFVHRNRYYIHIIRIKNLIYEIDYWYMSYTYYGYMP